VIRSLAQAVYQQTNIGHFGLALEEYAHFTSPIRRYPDLLVHRAIKAAVLPTFGSGHRYSTAELQTLGFESSQRERRADDAARDVMGYLALPVPAAARRRELRRDDYERAGVRFVRAAQGNADRRARAHLGDPGRLLGARGRRHGTRRATHGRRWQMGDAVRVRLSRVDLAQRQIDFELLDGEAAASHGTVRARGAAPRASRGSRGGAAAPRVADGLRRGGAARRSGGGRGGRGGAADAEGLADNSAISFTVCTRLRPSSSVRPSGCSSCGWPSRATMRGREPARTREAVGVRVQTATAEALAKLVGDVAHQGAVAAVRPLKAWDEHDLLAAA
jgi:ribonuclease R